MEGGGGVLEDRFSHYKAKTLADMCCQSFSR